MTQRRIVPESTDLTSAYWAAAREGRIALQRCVRCQHTWHPPAPVCPHCRSTEIEWVPSSGQGRLYSYTVVEHAVHPAVNGAVPYLVALVDLDEGPRIVTTLVEVDEPAELVAGTPITFRLGPAAAGAQLPVGRVQRAGAADAGDPIPPA
jgi:uncharacterized OB-fold protein